MRGSRLSGSALFIPLFYHLCVSASRRDALSTACEKRYARPPEASVTLFCAQHQSEQSRTQHYVCWDSVVPSPCPTRATKAFWKVIRFSRCFCCQNAFSGRKSAWQIVSIPCPVRVAPFWKDAAEECGLRVPMNHFPFCFVTKKNLLYHLCVASSRMTARFTAPRSVAPRPHLVSPSWSRCA